MKKIIVSLLALFILSTGFTNPPVEDKGSNWVYNLKPALKPLADITVIEFHLVYVPTYNGSYFYAFAYDAAPVDRNIHIAISYKKPRPIGGGYQSVVHFHNVVAPAGSVSVQGYAGTIVQFPQGSYWIGWDIFFS